MSTKTTFKRIALVTVAALGFGVLTSVAPASADTYVEGSFSRVAFMTPTSTGTIANEASAVISVGGACSNSAAGFHVQQTYYVAIVSAPATSNLAANSVLTRPAGANDYDTTVPTGYTQVNGTAYTLASQDFAAGQDYAARVMGECTAATSSMTVYAKVRFTPDKAGTYVIAAVPADNSLTRATATWTVTVAAQPTVSATASTSYATAADTTTAGAFAFATDLTGYLIAAKAAGTLAGVHYVVQDNGSPTDPLSAGGKLTVTVSGSGMAAIVDLAGACSYANSARALTGTSTLIGQKICFYSDGTAGTGTVTWSVGTTVLGSSTATFYGAAAKYTASATYSVIGVGESTAAATVSAVSLSARKSVKVLVTDANGNPVPGVTVYMNSSDTTVIAGTYTASGAVTSSTGYAYWNLSGIATGTANLSFTNKVSANDPLITTANPEITAGPVAVRVGSNKADKVTIAFDKAEYLPGEKATITLTVVDSKGNAVPRGVHQLFNSALSSNFALAAGTLPGTANANASCADGYGVAGTSKATCDPGYTQTAPALLAGEVWISGSTGTATYTINMPLVPGTVTVSGTNWLYLPNGLGTSANAGTAISATAKVATDGAVEAVAQAAADAAAEATDAANAATDAANAAAEAADAATAAAQDAADAVAALSAQVASLISGLKAQLTALTNLVIKIQKKVKA